MIKVQVSPFIGISEWVDPHSGITFSKKAGAIQIPDGTDLTGIKKHIRLNQLIVVGGELTLAPVKPVAEAPVIKAEETLKVEEVKPIEVEPIEDKIETPVEEVAKTTPAVKTSNRSRKKN
jgi:hypothetical protein